MNYPRGLIRYSTENALKNRSSRSMIVRRSVRPRVLVYTAVFVTLLVATAWSLATRVPLKVDIERDRAALAVETTEGLIENTYRLQLINASEQARTFAVAVDGIEVAVDGIEGIHLAEPLEVSVPAASAGVVTAQVRVEPGVLHGGSHPIRFTVVNKDDPRVVVVEDERFWMP